MIIHFKDQKLYLIKLIKKSIKEHEFDLKVCFNHFRPAIKYKITTLEKLLTYYEK